MSGEKVYIVKAFTRVAHSLRVSASSITRAEARAQEGIGLDMTDVWDKSTVEDISVAEVTSVVLEDGDST